jgi:hypothetical protein
MIPYKEINYSNYIIREFDQNVDPEELKWHRDREDRLIESMHSTDWKFQIENKLPEDMNKAIFIPKGVWHRLIKGSDSIKVKIIKK